MRSTHNKIGMNFYGGDLTSFPDGTGMVRGTLPWFLLLLSTPKFVRGASTAFSLPPITASGCFAPIPAPGPPTTCKADFSLMFSILGFSFSLLSRCIWKLAIFYSSFRQTIYCKWFLFLYPKAPIWVRLAPSFSFQRHCKMVALCALLFTSYANVRVCVCV